MTKEIPLTQGRVALVDDEDYEWLSQWKWCLRSSPSARNVYAGRRCPVKNDGYVIRMHREILSVPRGMEVDHINGDGLDNRRKNLRIVTRKQSARNSRVKRNSRSGYKGVFKTRNKTRNPWYAQLYISGRKTINLGYFRTPEEAALAYNAAAQSHNGEYAWLNKVNNGHQDS